MSGGFVWEHNSQALYVLLLDDRYLGHDRLLLILVDGYGGAVDPGVGAQMV